MLSHNKWMMVQSRTWRFIDGSLYNIFISILLYIRLNSFLEVFVCVSNVCCFSVIDSIYLFKSFYLGVMSFSPWITQTYPNERTLHNLIVVVILLIVLIVLAVVIVVIVVILVILLRVTQLKEMYHGKKCIMGRNVSWEEMYHDNDS